jgi:hypothetical protein
MAADAASSASPGWGAVNLGTFTSDEAWGYMRRLPGDPDSVHMAEFPSVGDLTAGLDDKGRALTAQYERLMAVRETVLKSLKSPAPTISSRPAWKQVVLRAELLPLLRVRSRAALALHHLAGRLLGHSGLSVEVHKAEGVKCERC